MMFVIKQEKINRLPLIIKKEDNMKKFLFVSLIICLFLGFYFYKPKINIVDYKKYKYYDEEYIDKYNGKILKSYDEYLEFIVNQGLLLNRKDFEKKFYAVLFIFDSCRFKYSGIDVDYGNPKYNESINIQVQVKELGGNKCNNQKIVLVPISKDKALNHDRVIYSFVGV